MIAFTQLPDEPSEAYEPLLLHRHFEPGRQFSKTAEAVGCSESTLLLLAACEAAEPTTPQVAEWLKAQINELLEELDRKTQGGRRPCP